MRNSITSLFPIVITLVLFFNLLFIILMYNYKVPKAKIMEIDINDPVLNFFEILFYFVRYVYMFTTGYFIKKYFTISIEAISKTCKILALRSFSSCKISRGEYYLFTFYLNFRNDKYFETYFTMGYFISLLMTTVCYISRIYIISFADDILKIGNYTEKKNYEIESKNFLLLSCFSFTYMFYFHFCHGIFEILNKYLASLKNFPEIEAIFYTNKVDSKKYPDIENFKIAVKNNIYKNRIISNYDIFETNLEMIIIVCYYY